MADDVTITFGDGSTDEQSTLGTAISHTYTAGGFNVTATTEDGRRGRTRVRGPGKFDIVADVAGKEPPPSLTLTVPDVSIAAGNSDVEQETELTNSGGSVTGCTGRIVISKSGADALTPEQVTMTMPDFGGPGADLDVTFAVEGQTLVGSYGEPDGFVLTAGQQGATTNHWDVDDAAKPGAYPVVTHIVSSDGDDLATADWTLTVEPAAAAVPDSEPESQPESEPDSQPDDEPEGEQPEQEQQPDHAEEPADESTSEGTT